MFVTALCLSLMTVCMHTALCVQREVQLSDFHPYLKSPADVPAQVHNIKFEGTLPTFKPIVTAEARVRCHVSPNGISGGKVTLGQVLPECFGFPLSESFNQCSM
jgi:hypothetical protein